jgi:hypothetical protein
MWAEAVPGGGRGERQKSRRPFFKKRGLFLYERGFGLDGRGQGTGDRGQGTSPLDFVNQVHMRQHMLTTTITTKAECIQYLIFRRIRNRLAIHVKRGSLFGTTEFLDFLLVEEPLIGKDVSAVHTTNGDNHERCRGCPFLSVDMSSIFKCYTPKILEVRSLFFIFIMYR